MVAVNATMAPLLFYTYFAVVFFILLNMFLAIVNDSYAEVKAHQSEEDIMFYINLRNQVAGKLMGLFKKKQVVTKFAKDLEFRADLNNDDLIDLRELESVLKDNPRALELLKTKNAAELLKKYDVNRDGVLTKAEMTELLSELYQKELEISKEIEGEKQKADTEIQRRNTLQRHGSRRGGLARTASIEGSGGVSAMLGMSPEVESRLQAVEGEVRDMSRNMAKKLSLMIDLLMSISDQMVQGGSGPARVPGDAPGSGLPPRR